MSEGQKTVDGGGGFHPLLPVLIGLKPLKIILLFQTCLDFLDFSDSHAPSVSSYGPISNYDEPSGYGGPAANYAPASLNDPFSVLAGYDWTSTGPASYGLGYGGPSKFPFSNNDGPSNSFSNYEGWPADSDVSTGYGSPNARPTKSSSPGAGSIYPGPSSYAGPSSYEVPSLQTDSYTTNTFGGFTNYQAILKAKRRQFNNYSVRNLAGPAYQGIRPNSFYGRSSENIEF